MQRLKLTVPILIEMEAYVSGLGSSMRAPCERLIDAYNKNITKGSCTIYMPTFENEFIRESVTKTARFLNPTGKVTFTQDWDDEFSIKVTMTFTVK